MIRFLSNVPISRRLFISYTTATVIPTIVIILLGNFYLSQLTARSQAVQTSFDAQSLASQQQSNLQRMNALVQTRFNQIFASLQGKLSDPSLDNAGGLVDSDIAARQAQFGQELQNYQTNFDLATSPNMTNIRSILISDDPSTARGIIADQQAAINSVAMPNTGLWAKYSKLQQQEVGLLDSLDPTVPGNPTTLSSSLLSLKYQQAYSVLWHANFDFTDLNNSWQRVVNDSVTMGKTVTAIGPSVTQPIFIATMLAVVLTFMIVFAIGWLVSLTIVRPLRHLATLTKRIARGETSARASILGHDEVFLVATLMNSMLDSIVHLMQDAQIQRDNLQAQVEKLVNEVSGVAEGDLRIQAEVTTGALGVLADSFNYMVEELSALIVRVKMVANEVQNSTTMTYERLTQLVASANTQIDQISVAVNEVKHMADLSWQVAERAHVLSGVAGDARQTVQTGRESVQQTVEGMGYIQKYVQDTSGKVQTLGDRSREINSIVEVISTIAHQTNRLALDAAIQAAMAGENGKGFGAVAADIRRLAERAKEESSSVARVLRSVREDIGAVAVSMHDTERETSTGANLAQETGASLEALFRVVEHQAHEIENINRMAAHQLQSSNSIVQIMQSIYDTTHQNSSSTRNTAQEMERLARLAEQLLASVEAFKLHGNLNSYAPGGNMTVAPQRQHEDQLTVSGVFRIVTAAPQTAGIGGYAFLTAGGGAHDVAYPPTSSYPEGGQGNGNDWPSAPNSQGQPQQANGWPPQQQ